MSVLAFLLLAGMIAAYVLLDGYDLGVAAITPIIARDDRERAASMQAIGPFWSGNEVWLIAAGGALFALFPKAYASAFSGFYLPFMIVLWLLMFRGIAIELRGHFPTRIWHDFWDFCFSGASTLLVALLGIALGNLVRGVPLDAHGYFIGTFGFLLNPYALGVGVLAILALALQGACFIMLRIEGPPTVRAARLAMPLWWGVLAMYLLITVATFFVRFTDHAINAFGAGALVIVSLVMLVTSFVALRRNAPKIAFVASSAFVGTLIIAAAATLYPYLLPSFPQGGGISIFAASPSPGAMLTTLIAVVVGLCVTLGYAGVVLMPQLFVKIPVYAADSPPPEAGFGVASGLGAVSGFDSGLDSPEGDGRESVI